MVASVHLLVLIHGMWGHPGHLAEMDRIIRETNLRKETDIDDSEIELAVLLAEANRHDGTYDGIDWGGERVAQEVMKGVDEIESGGRKVTRFSVTGYSLGGLVARYLVGILLQRGFFDRVTPVNFCTVATPHLGIPSAQTLWSTIRTVVGSKLLSRTGEQFYCMDQWSDTGKPLLEVMADPQGIFYKTLLKFPHLRIYGNAINDTTVPYVTALIETEDPFADYKRKGLELEIDDKYRPIIKAYTLPDNPPPPIAKPVILSLGWLRSFKPDRPLLPPLLQFRFPLNILLFILLPLLVPSFLSLAVVRLSWSSYRSRARIKLLEKDESHQQSLIFALAKLEKKVEDVVADMMDNPGSDSDDAGTPLLNGYHAEQQLPLSLSSSSSRPSDPEPEQILKPVQLRIAACLNTLPHLKKERAFIENVINSHAPIVCRDVKRFSVHRAGEGVIRHWADNFLL